MSDLEQVMQALRNADAAGNTQDARRLAVIADKLKDSPARQEKSLGAMPFVNRSIAETVGAPVDLITSGINLIPGVDIKKPFLGKESIESGMESIGIKLPKEGQVPETVPEHIGGVVGTAAAMLNPTAAGISKLSQGANLTGRVASSIWNSMIKHPYLTMAGETTGAIGAGAARGVAEKEFPDSPGMATTTEMAGGLAAAAVPGLMINTPTMLAIRGGRNVLYKLALPFTKKGGTHRAGEYVKSLAAVPEKAAADAAAKTISDLPPSVASGEKKIVALYKSLIGQDPLKDAETIEKMSRSIIKLEGEMRKLGYGSPELLADITKKRVAALEMKMDQRIIEATNKAQAKLDKLPVAQRKATEARIVRSELQDAMSVARSEERSLWRNVDKDFVTGFKNTRDTYKSLYDDLGKAQRGDVPSELKNSSITNPKGKKAKKVTETTLREMQSLRSKLLESARIARKDGKWNKARIAGEVADAIMEDLGVAADPETFTQIAIRSKMGTVKAVDPAKGGHIQAIDELPINEQIGKDGGMLPIEDGMITSKGRFVKRPKDSVGDDIDGANLVGQRVGASASSAEAENLRAALDYSRQFKARFESGEVGRLLGYSKSGAPAINPDLTLEMTVGRMGERGAIDLDQVVVSPEAEHATKRWLARSFTDYSDPNNSGVISPIKAERWVKNNEAILDKYPELRNQLTDTSKAQSVVDETQARMQVRKKALRDPTISESARFLNNVEMGAAVKNILSAPHPSRSANELVKQANKDATGKALRGLRAGFVEHILEKSHIGSYNDLGEKTLSGNAMLGFIKGNEPTLRQVFDNNQISRMKRIAGELSKVEAFEKINPGKVEIEMKDWASNSLRMFGRLTGAKLGGKIGASSMGGSLQYASIFSGRAQKFMTWLSKDMAQQIIHDAILSKNPKLLQSLLRPISKPKASKKALISLNKNLNLWLASTGQRVINQIESEEQEQ